MNFKDILHKFRTESFTEREKGTKFERLMRSWLLTDPRYNELEKVWLWEDFPGRKYNPQIEMFARFKMKSSFHKTKRII